MEAQSEEIRLADCVSAQQLALYYGIEPKHIRRDARHGRIPGTHLINNGRTFVFEKDKAIAGYTPPRVLLQRRDLTLAEKAKAQHDPSGNFAQGNQVSVGNRGGRPSRAKEVLYLKSLKACVTLDEWKLVVAKALEQAKAGKHNARVWLANYLIGKPITRIVADVDFRATQVLSRAQMTELVEALFLRIDVRSSEDVIEGEFRETPGPADTA